MINDMGVLSGARLYGVMHRRGAGAAMALSLSCVFALGPAHAEDYAPFVTVESVYTENGYNKGISPGGASFGVGITTGVIFKQQHEVSFSTGFTEWRGDQFLPPLAGYLQLQQVPLLLNYRFNYPLDMAKRVNISMGPTIGVIRQELLWKNESGSPLLPSQSDYDWRVVGGGGVGLNFKISSHWMVNARVQYLRGDQASYIISSPAVTIRADFQYVDQWSYAWGIGYSW